MGKFIKFTGLTPVFLTNTPLISTKHLLTQFPHDSFSRKFLVPQNCIHSQYLSAFYGSVTVLDTCKYCSE